MAKTQSRPRIVKGKELVKDIRSRMTDFQLIEKYGLTFSDFDRLLGYLVDAELITREELQGRQQLSDSQSLRAFVESSEDVQIDQYDAPRLHSTRSAAMSGRRQRL
jgi:hypothetical protein